MAPVTTTLLSRRRPNGRTSPARSAPGSTSTSRRMCAAGPAALAPDDHYRLKTYGVCPQRDDDRFMMRMRVAGGLLDRHQAETVADAGASYSDGQVHFTTRQNVELHSVRLADVPALYARSTPSDWSGRSACGHTDPQRARVPGGGDVERGAVRRVVPDARRLSRLLVARVGGAQRRAAAPAQHRRSAAAPRCGLDALINDIGLVACVVDGECGYQLWVGGSLGTAPRLSLMLRPFVRREELWPAVWTIIEWFVKRATSTRSPRVD